jgi:hypothetical protein
MRVSLAGERHALLYQTKRKKVVGSVEGVSYVPIVFNKLVFQEKKGNRKAAAR